MVAILIRSVLLVCFAVFSMRLMGKRQIGQLQPFELVIAIMIADLASSPMESLDTPLWRGVAPLLATVALHQLFTLLSLKSQRLRAFFSGRPTVVIRDGRAAILESDCPGGDCIHSGWISQPGRSIVCLPNRVELRIAGQGDVDFVVG